MKISKEKKASLRLELIETFTSMVESQGMVKVTMAKLAKEVGMSPSTIYNYFPSKEKLLFAFFELRLEQAAEDLAQTEQLEEYRLQEALQLYLDLILERFEAQRSFVKAAAEMIQSAPFSSLGELHQLRQQFLVPVEQLFSLAIDRGEIVQPPMRRMIEGLFADLTHGLLFYWLRDESENSEQTAQLIDMSLGLGVSFLESGLLNKGMDLVYFLFRRHLTDFAGHLEGLMGFKQRGFSGLFRPDKGKPEAPKRTKTVKKPVKKAASKKQPKRKVSP